jgi:hypothetical protein
MTVSVGWIEKRKLRAEFVVLAACDPALEARHEN